MRVPESKRDGRRRKDRASSVLRLEEQSAIPHLPAREKLLADWPTYKRRATNYPADFQLDGIDPYVRIVEVIQLVSAFAPDKMKEVLPPEREWERMKKYLQHAVDEAPQGYITRFDLWLTQAAGARLMFPKHHAEIAAIIRPTMERMFQHPSYFGAQDIGNYLLSLHMADPEFPGFEQQLQTWIPQIREWLEQLLEENVKVAVVVNICSRLFLLSPDDRDRYGERVRRYMQDHQVEIDADFRIGQMDHHFAGYHIQEPWYSALLHPEAKVQNGRVVFESLEPLVSMQSLPERPQV